MIKSLQSFRFIFIMFIFLSHTTMGKIGTFDFGGDCGVSFFIILSGFVLSLGYGESVLRGDFSKKKFFCKRLFKLYPLHIFCLLVFCILNMHHLKVYTIIPNIFLLQSWIPIKDFYFSCNAVSWFLSDIMFFYAAFPLLYRLIISASKKTLSVYILLSLIVYSCYLCTVDKEDANGLIYVFPVARLVDFSIGIFLCRVYKNILHKDFLAVWRNWQISALQIIPFLLIILLIIVYPYVDLRIRCASLFWIVISFTIIVYTLTDKKNVIITRILHSRILQSLGGISMEIFMIHTLAINMVTRIMMMFYST